MCCKNSYVLKKNEFDIGQYQKEIEEQKLSGKPKEVPQKSKRNKDFLDKHIKESNSKIVLNEPAQHIRQKLEESVKTAKRLSLKVKIYYTYSGCELKLKFRQGNNNRNKRPGSRRFLKE